MSQTNGAAITQTQDQPQQLAATAPQVTALAPAKRPVPLVPTNLDEAWRLSDALSRSSIIPDHYQGNQGNVLAAFYMAQDLGISVMQAMREIYVVKGKPTASSALKTALVRQSPECLAWECVESTKERATFKTRRRGDQKDTSLTFSIQQAEAAGLYPGKPDSAWRSYPENMLRWRAASFLADLVYPDVVKGLKTTEEMQDVEEREVPGERVFAETSAPPLPPSIAQAPAPSGGPVVSGEVVAGPPAEPKAEEPKGGAPDPAEVILNEIWQTSTLADIDALSKRAKEIPKEHPLRKSLGEAFNAARARVKAS